MMESFSVLKSKNDLTNLNLKKNDSLRCLRLNRQERNDNANIPLECLELKHRQKC